MMYPAGPSREDGGAARDIPCLPSTRIVRDNQELSTTIKSPRIYNNKLAKSLHKKILKFIGALERMSAVSDPLKWEGLIGTFFQPTAQIIISVGENRFLVCRQLMTRFFRTFQESTTHHWLTAGDLTDIVVAEPLQTVTFVYELGHWIALLLPDESNISSTSHMSCRFSFELESGSRRFKTFNCQILRHVVTVFTNGKNGVLANSRHDPTRGGLPEQVLHFLKTSELLSSMARLMTLQKSAGLSPRECLISTVTGQHQPLRQPTRPTNEEGPAGMDQSSSTPASRKRPSMVLNAGTEFQEQVSPKNRRREIPHDAGDAATISGDQDRQAPVTQRTAMRFHKKVMEFVHALESMPKGSCRFRWENFLETYFEPDALLNVSISLENGLNRFSVGRLLMSQFFRTFDESTDHHWLTLNEMLFTVGTAPSASAIVQFPEARWTLNHPPDIPKILQGAQGAYQVIGLEFSSMTRIHCRLSFEMMSRSLKFKIFGLEIYDHYLSIPRQSSERQFFAEPWRDPTRGGLPKQVLWFLRTNALLSSMETLIALHESTGLSPRECLIASVSGETQPLGREFLESSSIGPSLNPDPLIFEVERENSGTTSPTYEERQAGMDLSPAMLASQEGPSTLLSPDEEFQEQVPPQHQRHGNLDGSGDTTGGSGHRGHRTTVTQNIFRPESLSSQSTGSTVIYGNCRNGSGDDSSDSGKSPNSVNTPSMNEEILAIIDKTEADFSDGSSGESPTELMDLTARPAGSASDT